MSVPTVPCRWCLFPMPKVSVPNVPWQLFQCQQSQRQERMSQKCLCPLCRVAGVCFQCQKCLCQMCRGSCFSVNTANDKSASAKNVCAHCAVSLVSVSNAKMVCAKCAVAVVSVSTKPTTRALDPKMSVPTVPCRWCLFPMPKVSVPIVPWQLFQSQQSQRQERWSQKCLCPLCRVAGVCFQCQKCLCQMCRGSCFRINKANDKSA